MRLKKNILIKSLFFESFFILLLFTFKDYGLVSYMRYARENRKLENELEGLHQDIKNIKEQILVWQESSFYKEKIAREKLHMARPHDTIYKIVTHKEIT